MKGKDGECRYEYKRHDYSKEFFALQATKISHFLVLHFCFLALLHLTIQSKFLALLPSLEHNCYIETSHYVLKQLPTSFFVNQ